MSEIDFILREQDGVIARRQALAHGLTPSQIRHLVHRREWAQLHHGVYVHHTGPPTWLQRAWAGVLFSAPAALSHESALVAAEGRWRAQPPHSTIHVAIDRDRHLVPPSGVVLHRTARFDCRVEWGKHPPRIGYDDALLDVAAAAASDLDAVAQLADACGTRRTTPARLLATLGERDRIARRNWLRGVLTDVASGTCSVLEHGYLTRVERPHGLPRGRRQASALGDGVTVLRDVDYDTLRLVVELDGRLFHSSAGARERDLDRDLDAAALGGERETVRIGYGQVFGRGCRTAYKLGLVMQRRGWTGSPAPCGECG